jgi:hypothetical protein
MKVNKKIIIASIFILVVFSTACYFPEVMTEDQTVATEVKKALEEVLEKTESAKAAATYTPYPTYTPQPTYTSQPFRNGPYYEPFRPSDSGRRMSYYCNKAEFISENIPDRTLFNECDDFTKTWVLRNTGRCTWTTDYKLVFISGNSMSGDISSSLPYDVPPGGIVEVSVDLTAPSRDGTYKGNWAIVSDDGYRFANFWVLIFVR